ncbi:MAG: Holliday junction branch migration protein RuvA [Bacillota bacterium]|nr:Holliday junction branch migration protein RuvA [Bacillota bacterium]
MYEYITGKVYVLSPDCLAVDAGGMGYRVLVTPRTAGRVKEGETIKLFTHLHATMQVNDISYVLYGFASREEREMFEKLIAISGIGPKVAMAALSSLTASELAIAIIAEDATLLSRINGIGPKTAQRIILELKGRIQSRETGGAIFPAGDREKGGAIQEAIAALVTLGYAPSEAARAVSAVKSGADTVEEMVLNALRSVNDRR